MQGGACDDGWPTHLASAIDDIRQLAQGLFPGAAVELRSPAVADAWSAAALRSDGAFALPGCRGLAARVALHISDGSVLTVLTVEAPRGHKHAGEPRLPGPYDPHARRASVVWPGTEPINWFTL